MTKIEVTTHPDGYLKIEAKGHTNSVVCSAVSTALQSNIRFLQELSMQYPDELQIQIKEGGGEDDHGKM